MTIPVLTQMPGAVSAFGNINNGGSRVIDLQVTRDNAQSVWAAVVVDGRFAFSHNFTTSHIAVDALWQRLAAEVSSNDSNDFPLALYFGEGTY